MQTNLHRATVALAYLGVAGAVAAVAVAAVVQAVAGAVFV